MRFTSVVVFTLFIAAAALADGPAVSGGIYSGYMTQNGILLCNTPSAQVDVTVPIGRGFYADLWADQSLNGKNNEVDWTLGWSGKGVDVKAAFFQLDPVGSKNTTFYASTIFSQPTRHIGRHAYWMYAQADYIRPSFQQSADSGTWLRVGATDVLAFTPRTHLVQNGWVMRDNGVFGGPSVTVVRYEAAMSFQRTRYSFGPILKLSVPLKKVDGRERQLIFGLDMNVGY